MYKSENNPKLIAPSRTSPLKRILTRQVIYELKQEITKRNGQTFLKYKGTTEGTEIVREIMLHPDEADLAGTYADPNAEPVHRVNISVPTKAQRRKSRNTR